MMLIDDFDVVPFEVVDRFRHVEENKNRK